MPRVAVIGAGIGGLAAALALARSGCEVLLLERAAHLGETGAGLQLSSNAVRALDRLGLGDALPREAVEIRSLNIGRGRDAAVLARLPLAEAARSRFRAPFLVSLRSDLHRSLLAAVTANDRIRLETGCTLEGWSEAGQGLRLAVAGGASAGISVDGLVGADGLHSRVRQRLYPDDRVVYRGRTAWRSLIDTEQLPPRFAEPCSNLWLGRSAHLVHYPVAAGRQVNVVAVVEDRIETAGLYGLWSSPGDPHEIRARFAGWAVRLRELLDAAPSWSRWPLADRAPLPRWSSGRVTLLGDAAHPMLPFLAQGAAQALEDAAALGEATSATGDIGHAFGRYERLRLSRTTRVQAASLRQARVYHLGGPAAAARDAILGLTPAARLLAGYDWLYGYPG